MWQMWILFWFEKRIECAYCINSIASVHEERNHFKCCFCKAMFDKMPDLNKHIASVHEGSFEHFLKSCPTRFSPKIVSREDFWILFKILSQRGSCPVRSCPTRSYCNPNFDCSKKLFCFFISLLLYFFPWHDLYKPYSYWGHFWAPTTKRGLAFPQFFS